jgi:hypothetical protein
MVGNRRAKCCPIRCHKPKHSPVDQTGAGPAQCFPVEHCGFYVTVARMMWNPRLPVVEVDRSYYKRVLDTYCVNRQAYQHSDPLSVPRTMRQGGTVPPAGEEAVAAHAAASARFRGVAQNFGQLQHGSVALGPFSPSFSAKQHGKKVRKTPQVQRIRIRPSVDGDRHRRHPAAAQVRGCGCPAEER